MYFCGVIILKCRISMKAGSKYISPGAMLKTELKKRNLTQKAFAEAVSLVPSHVCEIISDKRIITPEVAIRLQRFFDIPAGEWLDLQTKFRLADYEDTEELRAVDELRRYDELVSLKTLFLRGGKPRLETSNDKLAFLNIEYGISSVKQLQGGFGFFKKSEKTGSDVRMLNTWTFLARKDSRQCNVTGKFDKKALCEIGRELSVVFHTNENTIMRTANVLSKHGIKFCITKKVDHASIDGFSFISDGVPSIVITRRFDRIDNLAFTVLHELYHVCMHLTNDGDQRINIDGYSEETQKEEDEANIFAANTLIPQHMWADAPAVQPVSHIIQKVYTKWAKTYGFNKWIVLGRIAHDLGIYQMRNDQQRSIL